MTTPPAPTSRPPSSATPTSAAETGPPSFTATPAIDQPTMSRPPSTSSLFRTPSARALSSSTTPTSAVETGPDPLSRRRVTASLFRTPSARTATRTAAGEDAGDAMDTQAAIHHGRSSELDDEGHRSEDSWTLHFNCIGAPQGEDFIHFEVACSDLTFGNLLTMKSQLGYGVRDYMYYKRRCGNAVATLNEIDYDDDANAMVEHNTVEREVRLVLSKEQVTDRNVVITPIKMARNTSSEEESADEQIDAYKDWLSYMHQNEEGIELEDRYREETVETYKEWLIMEGKLDEINAYANRTTSGHHSNTTPTEPRPSHARRNQQQGTGPQGTKKRGRGTLKGYKATNKRIRQGNQKLKVEFSRLGGPVGDNSRTFTDEIVMFTRKRAPLIGVCVWRDIHQDVKDSIASDILAKWDLENNDEMKEKIWKIAKERYKGWRSTFSATYRSYNSYDERMRHKPEDLDIVEWHYLVKYFGTEKFKRKSIKNSKNRSMKKTQHLTGSKPFSQCSYEQRDPETGEEPNDLEVWMLTHCKKGKWTNQASKDVYDKASLDISERESRAEQNIVSQQEKNQIFQRAYRAVTQCKSTKTHGNGYMSSYPTRRQLLLKDYQQKVSSEEALHQEHVELMGAFEKLQETIENQEAEREAERAEHRRQMEELMRAREADKEALRKEFMSMMQAAQQPPAPQQETNYGNKIAEVAAATSMEEGNENSTEHAESATQPTLECNPPQPPIAPRPPPSATRNTRSTAANNDVVHSQDSQVNAGAKYITTQQLRDKAAMRRRSSNKKNQ